MPEHRVNKVKKALTCNGDASKRDCPRSPVNSNSDESFCVIMSEQKPKVKGALGPFNEVEYKQILRIDHYLEANYSNGLTDNEVEFIKHAYLKIKDDEIIEDRLLVKYIFLKRGMALGGLTKSRKNSLNVIEVNFNYRDN